MTLEQTGEREMSEDALGTCLAHRRRLLENAITAIAASPPCSLFRSISTVFPQKTKYELGVLVCGPLLFFLVKAT